MKRITWILFLFLALPAVVLAQDGGPAPSIDWNQIIAIAINSVLVFTAVQLVKVYASGLSATTKQILALAGGPLLMMFAQPALSNLLGYPIDFAPLSNALGGLISSAAAMAAYDSAKLRR